MALDDATDATLPFLGDTVDLTNPVAVAVMFVSLVGGFALWNMAGDVGDTVAQRIIAFVSDLTGTNPATGEDSSNEAPLGGS